MTSNKMSRKSVIATAGVSVIAAASIGIPAVASTHVGSAPQATVHTMHFTAVTLKQGDLGKHSFGQAEKDMRAGKKVGFDIINGTFNRKTKMAVGRFALSAKGGMLYGKFAL